MTPARLAAIADAAIAAGVDLHDEAPEHERTRIRASVDLAVRLVAEAVRPALCPVVRRRRGRVVVTTTPRKRKATP